MAMAIEAPRRNGLETGPTRADVLLSLRFATLVESNPELYSKKILAAADRDHASWLRRLITVWWLPQEAMHGPVFRKYLIASGAMQPSQIDAEIEEIQKRDSPLGEGYSALEACTYGWIQEMVTWRFYQTMQKHAGEPVLYKILNDVGRQENFHRYMYLNGVKTILKYEPSRIREVIETVKSFEMPGHYTIPELQPNYSSEWAKKFGFPRRVLFRDIAKGLIEMVGYEGLGEIVLSYGAKKLPWYLAAPVNPILSKTPGPINNMIGRTAKKLIG